MYRYLIALGSLLCTIAAADGQGVHINPSLLHGSWPAYWIKCPGAPQREYGVYHFRKSFDLAARPSSFIIHLTADNQYRLFVNGKPVNSGPAHGDLFNWYFESIDIAPYLAAGNNTLAVMVWNMGVLAAVGQISNETAFVLQGDSAPEQIVNTDKSWKVIRDTAYTPCSTDNMQRLHAYFALGPGDRLQAAGYPWGWQERIYNDAAWLSAAPIVRPDPVGYGTDNRWTLAPRPIPLFHEQLQRLQRVRRSDGITMPPAFVSGTAPVTIPANRRVSVLFDQGVNSVAYPQLVVSRGKNATVTLTYAEALVDSMQVKGNRNDITHKTILGNYDIFIADTGTKKMFRPLYFRTYRYLQLDIETANEPIVLEDLYGMATGYPLEEKASFTSNDTSLLRIWEVGWRTARLCAGDAYYDCPYYEQLQYTGDSRIQSLISLYVAGDDRLMRKSILDFYHSRTPEGLTQGRYPSNRLQIITTFSLFWVSMVHDYWMLRKDDAFVQQLLPAIAEILNWYNKHLDQRRQMLGPLTWWSFVDWDAFESMGAPPGAMDGNSSILSLQYAYTLKQAAELFAAYGKSWQAGEYTQQAKSITTNTYKLCFDPAKGLMANTPAKNSFSQHAGIWSILSGAVPESGVKTVMTKILQDTALGQVTFFYRFYLTQAMKKAGLADRYYSNLGPWRNMLDIGLTTFAEKPEPTRSDCHAWSASPNYDFLSTICGIMPAAPGFSKVLIQPALGELTDVHGTMPHVEGVIELSLAKKGARLDGFVTLPGKLTGTFIWKGKSISLHPGKQVVRL